MREPKYKIGDRVIIRAGLLETEGQVTEIDCSFPYLIDYKLEAKGLAVPWFSEEFLFPIKEPPFPGN